MPIGLVEERLKIFKLFHALDGDGMSDAWCMTAIQVWDLVVKANPTMPPSSDDMILACALISYRLTENKADKQVGDAAAIYDDTIREKILKMGGSASKAEKKKQWKRITDMEEVIYKEFGSNLSRASFLDIALWVSTDVQEFAMSNDVAVAAEPQVFQGWRLDMLLVIGAPITRHAQVTSMLVELAFMHLPHETCTYRRGHVALVLSSLSQSSDL